MDELKPCPFCGSLNLEIVTRQSVDAVECKECHVKGPSTPWGKNGDTRKDNEARIVKHWNTRTEASK